MSILSHAVSKLVPLAKKVNEISGSLGKQHIHTFDHGNVTTSANGRPVIVQTCTICSETRAIPLS